MCWSATAGLVAGIGIGVVGVACVARVRVAATCPLAALTPTRRRGTGAMAV
ncbi:DUF6629 family protein [Streptomyces sp. NPDC017673]|uniref:DUF6629 family protein n=1 Tax=unclassified Streptomyces TaxID=2593676 RepID=UPI0037BC43EA